MVKSFYISIFHLIERRKEGMIIINACSMCLTVEETIDHVLLTCTMANRIWNSIFSGVLVSFLRPGNSAQAGRTMWRGCPF